MSRFNLKEPAFIRLINAQQKVADLQKKLHGQILPAAHAAKTVNNDFNYWADFGLAHSAQKLREHRLMFGALTYSARLSLRSFKLEVQAAVEELGQSLAGARALTQQIHSSFPSYKLNLFPNVIQSRCLAATTLAAKLVREIEDHESANLADDDRWQAASRELSQEIFHKGYSIICWPDIHERMLFVEIDHPVSIAAQTIVEEMRACVEQVTRDLAAMKAYKGDILDEGSFGLRLQKFRHQPDRLAKLEADQNERRITLEQMRAELDLTGYMLLEDSFTLERLIKQLAGAVQSADGVLQQQLRNNTLCVAKMAQSVREASDSIMDETHPAKSPVYELVHHAVADLYRFETAKVEGGTSQNQ